MSRERLHVIIFISKVLDLGIFIGACHYLPRHLLSEPIERSTEEAMNVRASNSLVMSSSFELLEKSYLNKDKNR